MSKVTKHVPVLGFSEDSGSAVELGFRTKAPCGFSFFDFFLLVVFSCFAIKFCYSLSMNFLLHRSFATEKDRKGNCKSE